MRESLRRTAVALHLLGHPARLAILLELWRGEAVVYDLAARLGIDRPGVSYHLSVLLKEGLVATNPRGRRRRYALDASRPELLGVLRNMRQGTAPGRATATIAPFNARGGSRGDLRFARTCYDHLAGGVGVYLFEELLRLGWLGRDKAGGVVAGVRSPRYRRYDLTTRGIQELRKRKVNVLKARLAARAFAFACPDWTLGRDHLGGALGAAVLRTLASQGLVRAQRSPRGLVVVAPLSGWFHSRAKRGRPSTERVG